MHVHALSDASPCTCVTGTVHKSRATRRQRSTIVATRRHAGRPHPASGRQPAPGSWRTRTIEGRPGVVAAPTGRRATMTTLWNAISQSAVRRTPGSVSCCCSTCTTAPQKQFLRGVRAPAQPGGRPSPAISATSSASRSRTPRSGSSPASGRARRPSSPGSTARSTCETVTAPARLRTGHPLAALQRPARDRRQPITSPEPAKGRLQAAPRLGRRRRTARPHLHGEARQREEGREDPLRVRLARRRGRREHPAAPDLALHARQPGRTGRRGRGRPPGGAAPCVAGSPRSGRSRRPSTRIWSRTATSTTRTRRAMFFTRAALPAVHHVTAGAARDAGTSAARAVLPGQGGLRHGAGPAARPAGRGGGRRAPASPVDSSTIFQRDDIVVRLSTWSGRLDAGPRPGARHRRPP